MNRRKTVLPRRTQRGTEKDEDGEWGKTRRESQPRIDTTEHGSEWGGEGEESEKKSVARERGVAAEKEDDEEQ